MVNFLYFFHDFSKIKDTLKNCQNYTIAAIPYGGHHMACRLHNLAPYGMAFRPLTGRLKGVVPSAMS
jgi:hypothetical protein